MHTTVSDKFALSAEIAETPANEHGHKNLGCCILISATQVLTDSELYEFVTPEDARDFIILHLW